LLAVWTTAAEIVIADQVLDTFFDFLTPVLETLLAILLAG